MVKIMSITKIGSFSWMQMTNGHLKAKEKIKLANTIIIPSVMGIIRTQLKAENHIEDNIALDNIKVPDSKIIVEAIKELDGNADTAIINHSWRTYFWGAALGHIHNREYDPEVLLVSSLFHDLGLTDAYRKTKGCKCFTYESAIQFEKKAQEISYDEQKSIKVKDAICMHMNGFIDENNEPEIILLQQGASCDVIGDKLYTIPKDFRNELLRKYPRENFNKIFKGLLAEENKSVKESRTNFLSKLGLTMMISMNPYKD